MMTRRIGWLTAVLVMTAATALLARSFRSDRFPHEDHARLFPLCIGCHAGIPEGNPAEYFPDPAVCVNCHDGTRAPEIDWRGPTRTLSNLRFTHTGHAAEIAEDEQVLECSTCHTREGARRMEVRRTVPERCLACHAPRAREHFVDARCATCHIPLAETRFTLARMEALPEPSTHDSAGFLASLHGRLATTSTASCTTCHVRQQCAGCHVDAARVEPIARLAAAPADMRVPDLGAEYPLPESHRDPAWLQSHGAAASRASCSTCHTRESCATCHDPRDLTRPQAVALRTLPSRAAVTAPGVATTRRPPPSHASPYFATQHGAVAAGREETCASCHSQTRFCQSCHLSGVASDARRAPFSGGASVLSPAAAALRREAARLDTGIVAALAQDTLREPRRATAPPAPPRRRGNEFHPPNYVYRHSAEAYNRRLDCTSCHNSRVFCRDCHEQAGFGTVGRLNRGFHDAEPVWLLRHGQAARQTLESCASCHGQRDCMQCHAETGSFRINPHGQGFDARRAQRRNPRVCFACHLSDPLERRTP